MSHRNRAKKIKSLLLAYTIEIEGLGMVQWIGRLENMLQIIGMKSRLFKENMRPILLPFSPKK